MSHQPDRPVAGFYQMRLVRGGPLVPVRIWFGEPFDPCTGEWCERSHRWRAAIDGEQVSIWRAWPSCSGRPISEGDYRFMRAMSAHARTYEPGLPQANPLKPIDLNAMAPIF